MVTVLGKRVSPLSYFYSLGFHPTFSRHGIAQSLSALALRIWLNEKVYFQRTADEACGKGGWGEIISPEAHP